MYVGGFMEKPMTVEEATDFLSISRTYLYRLVRDGRLTGYNPGGRRLYFQKGDLEAYLLRGRRASSEELRERAEAILNRRR
jgi:excisionase family DNA binding protein